ncbi:hypothetical protein PVAND_000548 [Polypedilum vanderplanki]|uniref:Peptidase S1 domain-containing protein n=1 Tax=Polypedilum vanderplanki TaxID=319348 RepID=A0A9J6BKX5_POLVA|nr:hypothetical protein PVAND_000548 [Polypedilum vanderplanki]
MRFVIILLLCINITIICGNRSGRVVNLQQIQNRCLAHQSTAPRDRTCVTQKKLKMQITPNVEGANGVFYCLTYEKNIGPIYGFDTLIIQLHPDYDLQYSGANVIDYEFPSFKLYDVRVSEEYKGRFAIYSNNTAFKIYQVTINNEPQSCTYGRNKNRQKKWPEEKEPESDIEEFETEAETFHETPKNVLSAIPETPPSSSSTSTTTSTTPEPTTTTTLQATTPEPTTTTVRTTLSTSTTEAPQPSTTEQQKQKHQVTENIPEITSSKNNQKLREPLEGEDDEDDVDSSETVDPENEQKPHENGDEDENKPTDSKNEPETEIKSEVSTKQPEISATTQEPTTTTKQPELTTVSQKQPVELTTVKTTRRNRKPSLNSLQKQKERDPLNSKNEQKLKESTTIKNVKEFEPTTVKNLKDPESTTESGQNHKEPTTENDLKHKEPTTARTENKHHSDIISEVPKRPLNEDNCGIPQKIVDLKQYQMPYNPGEFPYAASIYHILDDDIYGNSYYKCSGSIINRRMILTSVNCVLDYNARLIDENNLIATVAHYKKDGQRTSSRTYDVEQVLPHEDYNYRLDNNIAALKLRRNIEFDEFVQPACLPEPTMDLEDDSVGKVVGFGKSNTLTEGDYNISLDDDCKDAPSTCKTINGNNTSGNVDATDLGCGLYMNNSNHYIVIGVVSIIPYPLTQDFGCIFTNVLFYLDWINRLLI